MKEDFDARLDVFLDKWNRQTPAYTDYFRRVWIEQYLPYMWAVFGQEKDVSSDLCLLHYVKSANANCVHKIYRQWEY
jgi:hypothetical protein